MAVYEVFSRPVSIRYKTHLCSRATCFHVASAVFILIFPFLITFYVQGFWKKHDVYREQPHIAFKHQVLLVLETKDPGEIIFWSTFEELNKVINRDLQTARPSIEHKEEDYNRDGKKDELKMSIEVPLVNQKVVSVKLILVFEYKLNLYSSFEMESIAYIHHSSPLMGSSFTCFGDLTLSQKEPVKHAGSDSKYNIPVIDMTDTDHLPKSFENILSQYHRRNVTTYLKNMYPVWESGYAANQAFKINLVVLYPEQTILYKVGFWQLLKWALVQYMTVFVIVFYCLQRIKNYLFTKRIIPSIVIHPAKDNI